MNRSNLVGLVGLVGSLAVSACGGATVPAVARDAGSAKVAALCEGPITIRKQADVRSVAATCGSIDGDLQIIGSDITNLDGLENIHSVRYLVVVENPKLTNVRGLRGLVSARGVTFMQNPSLESLEGLERLSVLDGAVIAENGARSLQGFDGLRSAGEAVVAGNPRLGVASGLAPFAAIQPGPAVASSGTGG